MAKNVKSISITMDDVSFIFNEDLTDFYSLTTNCFCRYCNNGYSSTITNYSILLNSLNDIELNGFCQECFTKLSRYIETGENKETRENAIAVWGTSETLKELKIKKGG